MEKSPNDRTKNATEQVWASILLRALRKDGCDYQIAKFVTPEWSADVDVFALSQSKGCEPLYLQLCCDIVFLEKHNGAKLFKTDSSSQDSDTSAIIKKKADRYTNQKKKFSHITLVVQKTLILPGVPLSYELNFVQKCTDAGFQAIYAVSPGGTHGVGSQAERIAEMAIRIC